MFLGGCCPFFIFSGGLWLLVLSFPSFWGRCCPFFRVSGGLGASCIVIGCLLGFALFGNKFLLIKKKEEPH